MPDDSPSRPPAEADGPSLEALRRENEALRQQLDDFLFHLPDALVESDLARGRRLRRPKSRKEPLS